MKIKVNSKIKKVKEEVKQKYYVEMFDTKSYVTTEEWTFESKEEAKDFFEECKSRYIEPSDKQHIEWILSTFDKDGDYVQLESYTYE